MKAGKQYLYLDTFFIFLIPKSLKTWCGTVSIISNLILEGLNTI